MKYRERKEKRTGGKGRHEDEERASGLREDKREDGREEVKGREKRQNKASLN